MPAVKQASFKRPVRAARPEGIRSDLMCGALSKAGTMIYVKAWAGIMMDMRQKASSRGFHKKYKGGQAL